MIANTTCLAETPRSPICFLPNSVKSSKPSTAFMSAKSPPAITLKARSSNSSGDGEHTSPRSRWRCQKSRQIETTWMLSRPVEPHPVKKSFPPLFNARSTVSAMPCARPDSTNSRYLRTTSPSKSNSKPRAAATSFFATSLRLAVMGWEDSVVRAPSWN